MKHHKRPISQTEARKVVAWGKQHGLISLSWKDVVQRAIKSGLITINNKSDKKA